MNANSAGYLEIEELKDFFPIDKAAGGLTPHQREIAPGRETLAIYRDAGENRLDKFHWGLVPFWATDVSIGKKLNWLGSCKMRLSRNS